LRFDLRLLYLRLMDDPKHVALRDIAVTAEMIAAEAAELGDPLTEGEALLRAGRLQGDIGRTFEGERTLARAAECFDRAGIRSAELAFVRSITFSWQGPHPVSDDIEHAEAALATADEASPIAAYSHLGLAVSRAVIGEIDPARAEIERGASILRELGMTLELAAAGGLMGAVVEMMAGDLVAAEGRIRPAYEALREMGEKARLSSRSAILAGIVYEQGRYDEAMNLAEETDSVSAPDDMEPQIWLRGVRAKVLARRGLFDQAEREARENARLAEETDWLGYTGMAWSDLAEVLFLAGRFGDAAVAARRAEEFLERKGSLVLLERVRRFREGLGTQGSGAV
jgi:tetratricopeptide (TPR) repeat protein